MGQVTAPWAFIQTNRLTKTGSTTTITGKSNLPSRVASANPVYTSVQIPYTIIESCQVKNIPVYLNPGKYFGLPIITGRVNSWGRSKREALAYIKDRLIGKMQGWKQCLLSPAGREVLIKAVAFAIPAYPMACFQFPKTLCNDLEKLIAKFWWGQKRDESKIHWHNWYTLSKAKDQGGMGFRDLFSFNDALLAKQGWRMMHNPNVGQNLKRHILSKCLILAGFKGCQIRTWFPLLTCHIMPALRRLFHTEMDEPDRKKQHSILGGDCRLL